MDDQLFRAAMGKFATGVTVIATETEEGPHGMTANAFMSVSLNPKLVVISIKENARILPKIQQSKKFSVNILAESQKDISMIFAGQLKDREVTFGRLAEQPIISGALANVTCEVSAAYIEGDHTLFIGTVTAIEVTDGNPLLFANGRYQTVATSVEV